MFRFNFDLGVTPANLEASQQAKEEKEQWKKDNPLTERMKKLAVKASGGTSTGMGLAGIGAQIAKAVRAKKGDDDNKDSKDKLSVEQVVKEI